MSLPTWSGARHPPRYFATTRTRPCSQRASRASKTLQWSRLSALQAWSLTFPVRRYHREARAVRDDDPLLVIFTSGSEASPKGAVLTHANCFWNNLALAQALPLTKDDVVLAVLPQFHVGGVERAAAPGLVGGCDRGAGGLIPPVARAATYRGTASHLHDGRADPLRPSRVSSRLGSHRHLQRAVGFGGRGNGAESGVRGMGTPGSAADSGLRTDGSRPQCASPTR